MFYVFYITDVIICLIILAYTTASLKFFNVLMDIRYLLLKIREEESLLFPFTIVKVKRQPPNKLTYGQVCRDLTDVKPIEL